MKSVRLDISVGRSCPALVHPPSQPNQPSPQASLCQTASALNGPKLGRFSRQPGRFRQPVEKFLHVVQNLNPSNSSQNHHRQEQKKRLVFKFFVQGQNYSRYLICCWYLRHKKCGREIFILFVTKHIFVIQIWFGIILTSLFVDFFCFLLFN